MRPIIEPVFMLPVMAKGLAAPTPASLGLKPQAAEAYIKTLRGYHRNRYGLLFHAPDFGENPTTEQFARNYFYDGTLLRELGDTAIATNSTVIYLDRERVRYTLEFFETDIWTEVRSFKTGKVVPSNANERWVYKAGNSYFKVVNI